MKKEDCIFCKIAGGQIPSCTVYEDEDFRVILDIAPAAKGHALILPKEHYDNLWELGEKEAAKVMTIASKVSAAQKKALGCHGVNVLQNNGIADRKRFYSLEENHNWTNNRYCLDCRDSKRCFKR